MTETKYEGTFNVGTMTTESTEVITTKHEAELRFTEVELSALERIQPDSGNQT
jgi:hypothetical protein